MTAALHMLIGALLALACAAPSAFALYQQQNRERRDLRADLIGKDNRIRELESQVRSQHEQGLRLPQQPVVELPPELDRAPAALDPEIEKILAGFDPDDAADFRERAEFAIRTRPGARASDIVADLMGEV